MSKANLGQLLRIDGQELRDSIGKGPLFSLTGSLDADISHNTHLKFIFTETLSRLRGKNKREIVQR